MRPGVRRRRLRRSRTTRSKGWTLDRACVVCFDFCSFLPRSLIFFRFFQIFIVKRLHFCYVCNAILHRVPMHKLSSATPFPVFVHSWALRRWYWFVFSRTCSICLGEEPCTPGSFTLSVDICLHCRWCIYFLTHFWRAPPTFIMSEKGRGERRRKREGRGRKVPPTFIIVHVLAVHICRSCTRG